MQLCVDYCVTRPTCMAPVEFQLDFFTVLHRTETAKKTRCLFTFWKENGRSSHSEALNLALLFTEPINFAKNQTSALKWWLVF